MNVITFEGEIIHTMYWNVKIPKDVIHGSYYHSPFNEMGKQRSATESYNTYSPKKRIFELLTTERVYRSEEIDIFTEYVQEGNSFIPINTKEKWQTLKHQQ